MTVGIEVSLGWVGKGQWCDGVKANSRFRHVISQTSMLTWIRINKRRLKGCTCVRACVCVSVPTTVRRNMLIRRMAVGSSASTEEYSSVDGRFCPDLFYGTSSSLQTVRYSQMDRNHHHHLPSFLRNHQYDSQPTGLDIERQKEIAGCDCT